MINVTIDAALGTDVDLKFNSTGKAYARFRAVSKERKRGNDGTWQDGDETWFSVVVFGKQAEMLAESEPAKGTRLLLSGTAKLETWEDREGNTKTGLSVIANHVALDLMFTAYNKRGGEQASRGAGERRSGGWNTDSLPDRAPDWFIEGDSGGTDRPPF